MNINDATDIELEFKKIKDGVINFTVGAILGEQWNFGINVEH